MASSTNPLAAGTNLGVPVISAPSLPSLPGIQTMSPSQVSSQTPSNTTALSPAQPTASQTTVTTPVTSTQNCFNIVNPLTWGYGPCSQTSTGQTVPSGSPAAVSNCSLTNLSGCLANANISVGRVAAFLLGLIFIAAGLFLLKPGQSIIVQAGRTARAIAA